MQADDTQAATQHATGTEGWLQPPHFVQPLAEWSAAILEVVGFGIITVLAIYAVGFAIVKLLGGVRGADVFQQTRHRLIRSILLGLEFLVAADIVHTVAVDLTFTSVGVLAIVVLIRTFLSMALELEMTGRFPWQHREQEQRPSTR